MVNNEREWPSRFDMTATGTPAARAMLRVGVTEAVEHDAQQADL